MLAVATVVDFFSRVFRRRSLLGLSIQLPPDQLLPQDFLEQHFDFLSLCLCFLCALPSVSQPLPNSNLLNSLCSPLAARPESALTIAIK